MINPMASHLKVLDCLMLNFLVTRVLETGLGEFSTGAFLKYAGHVTSIETDVACERDGGDWLNIVLEKFGRRPNWTAFRELELDKILSHIDGDIDLLFVDGSFASRVPTVEHGIQLGIRFVVAHDTENAAYNYSEITWPKYTDETALPHTTVFFRDLSDYDTFMKLQETE